MKAVLFKRPGVAEEVLEVGEVPVPDCGPGDVRIRVAASVIQPADRLFIAGTYAVQPRCPQVAGFEGVGVVDQVGPAVTDIAAGQRVAFRSPGAWADYAVVPRDRIYPVPPALSDRITDAVACQMPLNPLTAWGLLDSIPHSPGQRVLATAGHSVVAAVLRQLAARRDLPVDRLVRDADGYRLLGPDGAVVARGETVARTLAATAPYPIVLDPVGGPDTLQLIDRTEPGGVLVSYGVLDDRPFELRASLLLYRALRWQGFGISVWLRRAGDATLAAAAAECWAVLADDPALLPVSGRFALDEFGPALTRARASAGEGKAVFVMS